MHQKSEEKTAEQQVLNALESAGLVRAVNVNKAQLQSYFHSGTSLSYQTDNALNDQIPPHNNQIMEKMPHYLVEPEDNAYQETDSEQVLTESTKHYKIYINLGLPSNHEHIIEQWNNQELARMEFTSHPTEWLHHFTPFLSRSETEIALMLRFVKQRNAFFAQNTMLSADEVLEVLGLAKKNARRTVRDLSGKHQLILFKFENKLLAPAFQFNSKGRVYPALLSALPVVHQHNIDALELAMWLTSDFPALIASAEPQYSLDETSFEDMLKQAEIANQNSVFINTKPIDCLANSEEKLFNLLLNRWLDSDQFSLSSTTQTP